MRAALLAALLAPSAAAATSWRHDGAGVAPNASPPTSWTEQGPTCWMAPLPTWGNGSPVSDGQRICVTAEPSTLACFELSTGRPLFQARLDVLDALSDDERERVAGLLTAAEVATAELKEARASYARLQREVRRGADPSAGERLEALGARIASLQTTVDATGPYGTWADLGSIGYASPSPALYGELTIGLTGQGVVGAFDASGRRVWSRWLGPPVQPMRGWAEGHASSPRVVDGVLIVAYGTLRGLDPTTGEERWSLGPAWDHFGTPGVVDVAGLKAVVTPDGRVVRARDGRVLAEGLGLTYHVGPVVRGDRVWVFGNTGPTGLGAQAEAWRLTRQGDGLVAERLWHRDLPDTPNIGGQPLLYGDHLYGAELNGDALWIVDARTGETRRHAFEVRLSGCWSSPVVAEDRLYLLGEYGEALVLGLDGQGGVRHLALNPLEGARTSAWAEGPRLFVRVPSGLRCLGP